MKKCLVKGCNEHSLIDGEYVCPKCFDTLVTGYVGEGTTLIHDLKAELLLTSALIDRKAVIIAMAIDDRESINCATDFGNLGPRQTPSVGGLFLRLT